MEREAKELRSEINAPVPRANEGSCISRVIIFTGDIIRDVDWKN